jgi:hypothetical protein
MLYICNMQCGAQNAKHYTIVSALMQPLFKFWFAAHHARHLIPVPMG